MNKLAEFLTARGVPLTACWAAVFLLMCCSGSRLKALSPSDAAEPDTFHTEDLSIHAGDLRLAGTLYLPRSRPPAPAVVFVHGAGPAVRSERYHELARHFARKGVAALIYDKRGCAASTGDWTRAGLQDLAEDALACVRSLRSRPEINPTQVGLWGLSQGASIIPIAASRSPEVAFVIAVGGGLEFERQMRFFRANNFRRLGLPLAALDIANKTFLIQVDLISRIRSARLPAPRALQESSRSEFDLDQAAVWRQVHQPVLAIYGERDQHVPVAESSAALAAAVAQPGTHDFTLIIYPGASHSIGKTQTGEFGEKWIGYVPEYLEDMTEWVLQHTNEIKKPEGWSQRGVIPESYQPFADRHYDRLRWYGNAPVQAIQLFVFAVVFLVGATAGSVGMIRGRWRDQAGLRKWRGTVATAVSVLNLSLLTGLVFLTLGLTNQLEPSFPAMLNWLPLAGSLSAGLTLAFLALLFTRWRALADPRRARIAWSLFAICAIAFIPFLHYWNLLGLALHS